jgi:predicted nucleotidyltransferase component of viral defense system
MGWIAPERNYDKVQYESIRREIDGVFTTFHDALSKAYYDGTIIKSPIIIQYGYNSDTIDFGSKKLLDPVGAKKLFDLLHGINEEKRMIKFDEVNKLRSTKNRIPEKEYLDINIQQKVNLMIQNVTTLTIEIIE